LGRAAALCQPTESLKETEPRYDPRHPQYDPFRDDRPEVMKPIQVGMG
jgi:hypothetical protein